MLLRPVSFFIPSSTELKITFSADLSLSLTIDNFKITSLNGAAADLDLVSLELDGSTALLKTRPQIAGNYYLLEFLDTTDVIFASVKGDRLVDDDVSRQLFFVGIENVNPFRDRMYSNVPQLFEVQNTNLSTILSAQAEELYAAQKHVGELLSNNYIYQEVIDEPRTRSSGATDRLANENAFDIFRVAKTQTGAQPIFEKILYTNVNTSPRSQVLSVYPTSLQQVEIIDEEITSTSTSNSFNGFLLSVQKKNVIKLLSVKLIKSTDTEDCDGNLGTEYDVERYKYSLQDNFYDQDFAFKFLTLESNQILLSEFSNLERPTSLDTIVVSYLYKDLGRNILEDQVEVSRVEDADNESVPSNSTSFFLDHAPIVDSDNNILTSGGLQFQVSANSDEVPAEFVKELVFDSSKLPSQLGEYSVNYQTGEVFLVGSEEVGEGTGRNNYLVSYLFRREFIRDLDYSIHNQDLVPTPNRKLSNEEAEIFINYEKVFAKDSDYQASSHIEVMPEFVENRLKSSFTIETQHAPITNVYRILNQTTGEVYNPLFHSATEISFSGVRSPEIKNITAENSNFKKISNEELQVVGEFIIPTFEVLITSTASKNSITFTPGIPAELVDQNSSDYFFRELTTTDEEISAEDISIRFFGTPDGNNLITTAGISSTASPPNVNSTVIIGTRGFIINLAEEGILNKNEDALGSLVNTSITLSDQNIFLEEKYFTPTTDISSTQATTSGGISVAFTLEKDSDFFTSLSRLRKVGDYAVDYQHGVIYLAISKDQDVKLDHISYTSYVNLPTFDNIIDVNSISKKKGSPDLLSEAAIVYQEVRHGVEYTIPVDLENTLTLFDGETTALDLDFERQNICEVLDDYTVVVPYEIVTINSIFRKSDLTGVDLTSSNPNNRIAEQTATALTTSVKDGGRNIYDATIVSFEKNVIDLKTTISKRLLEDENENLTLQVIDSNLETFVKVVSTDTDLTVFDDELNITKLSGLSIVEVSTDDTSATVSLASGISLADLDTNSDYLLDTAGNRFLITSVDNDNSSLVVNIPADNNSTATEPEIDLLGNTIIVVKPTVEIADGVMTITIPSDSGLSSGELVEITYLTTLIPDIGTELAIDYRYGYIFHDYSYLADDLIIWYEYGDNALDWSISDTLQEGEEYFVSYRYGASRDALRTNFGSLTNIPYFKSFPLATDRELYRDALRGTLQAFSKGPTLPAFTELVKTFTKIEPDIDELVFGNWILGRDYLNPGKINYQGDLIFKDGRFDDGLLFENETSVSLPAISAISLQEGTLEAWVRPNWSGINNDATLTFTLDHIDQEMILLKGNDNPFDKEFDWQLIPVSNLIGGTDFTGLKLTIFNYRSDAETESGLRLGAYGIYKELEQLNQIIDYQSFAKLKLDFFGNSFNLLTIDDLTLQDSYTLATFCLPDGERAIGLSCKLSKYSPFAFTASEVNFVNSENLEGTDESGVSVSSGVSTGTGSSGVSVGDPIKTPSTGPVISLPTPPHPEATVSWIDDVSILEQFNEILISVALPETVSLLDFKNSLLVIDDTPETFILSDGNNILYQVVAFVSDGTIYSDSIPDQFDRLLIKKFGINDPYLSSRSPETIDDVHPTGNLTLFYKHTEILTNSNFQNSETIFDFKQRQLVNWTELREYQFLKDISSNLITFEIKNTELKLFYTDTLYSSDLDLELEINAEDLKGIIVAVPDENMLGSLELRKLKSIIFNRFALEDIYVGGTGYHPTKIPFDVNKDDFPKISVGEPPGAANDEGIYIWFDELCSSPLSDKAGRWIVRTRADRQQEYPTDVVITGDTYQNIFSTLTLDHTFSGIVETDGEFSSVDRASRDEIDGTCSLGTICSAAFRYCGNDLLENTGWSRLEETDSDLINVVIGGRETQKAVWHKFGEFDTAVSRGIYRMGPASNQYSCVENEKQLGNLIYIANPCALGDAEFLTSIKVSQLESDLLMSSTGTFSGAVSGNLTGIVPLAFNDQIIHLKVALGIKNDSSSLVLILDGENNKILDVIQYSWNDQEFHEYKLKKEDTSIEIYLDDHLISQLQTSDFTTPTFSTEDAKLSEANLAIYLLDASLVDFETYLLDNTPPIIDLDLVSFDAQYTQGDGYLEETDVLISTDDKIEFSFEIDDLDADDYSDGYTESMGVDEMFMSADRLRYLVDTGEEEGKNRFSIFKDGKGFINFRIYDDSLENSSEAGFYNLASNVKTFEAGELHHIGVSWKFNTIDDRDEMHLFIDGQEAPNIYKFGGKVPVKINDKFSDVSKEILQSFIVQDIDFCQTFTDGTVSASNSIFESQSATFTSEMIGRSIIITDGSLDPTLVGKEYIILSVVDSHQITLGRGSNLELITFNTSTSGINFSFPPTAGLISDILTDLKNSRFAIFRTDADGDLTELGGILYTVDDGEIDLLNTDRIIDPQYRANISDRTIEFVGQDSSCNYVASIQASDPVIHIETFGLNLRRCKEKIQLSNTSYRGEDDTFSGKSVLRSRRTEPVALADVELTRIIADTQVISISDPVLNSDGTYRVDFEIALDNDNNTNLVSSASVNLSKQNLGRLLSVVFESDNVNYCSFDGYQAASQDGYLDGQTNTITIYGSTTDGVDEETYFITGNNKFDGQKYFTDVSLIRGSFNVVDPDYFELGVISVEETHTVFESDNGGDYAEIYQYLNGHLVLTVVGSAGTLPFELHPGYYRIDYPGYLNLNLPQVGEQLFIGSDFNAEQQFGGVIDEFRIISEMSSDTRITEFDTSGTRSITNDYNASIPFCPDAQTLTLIPFDNPIALQSRRLRTTEFLNRDLNFKYHLTTSQKEKLLEVVNDSEKFISAMLNMNFTLDESTKTFYEVQRAGGGPLFNLADYYRNYIEFPQSESSVNDLFGKSAYFTSGPGILIKNDAGQFRKGSGTIEFWVSPILDTAYDPEKRYYVDIYSIKRERLLSTTSNLIKLPQAASKIIDIKLIQGTQEFSSFYSEDEIDEILFDEVARSQITGRLKGGTGSKKDFARQCNLSADGRQVFLAEALPAQKTDIIVSYVPIDSAGDRISIFKNESSQIIFVITAGGIDNVVSFDVDWKKNTWHRVLCSYSTNTGFDTMKVFGDGKKGGFIRYGTGLIYGTGLVYGQFVQGEDKSAIEFNIPLDDEFRLIAIGSDVFGDHSARARMDNLRFSRIIRDSARDASGSFIDLEFSDNTNSVSPVIQDDATTLLLDFDEDGEKVDQFVSIIDAKSGIFDFDLTVYDNFDRVIDVNDGEIEDLLITLVDRLKPAHSNANVKFVKNRC